MIDSLTPNRQEAWFQRAPWLILLTGIILALAITALLFIALMQPPRSEIRALMMTLGVTSLLSLGAGYVLYRRGWARSTSLARTLVLTYAWAALLTLINVGVMQQQMFVSEHDLILGGVLLLFAAIIATSFGVFVAASVADGLHTLTSATQRLANGDLDARVTINGRDELAQVGTAFNEMAEQLQQTEKQRAELEKLRRDLIAWTSHDLRTPLTSIRVRVEALHDGLVDEPETRQRFYRDILADVVSLNTLIDDLFELAQLEAGGLRLEMFHHALPDLISDSLERFQPLAARRGVALSGGVATDVDLVWMNPSKVTRVLSNLLSNALRHTPDGGEVRVTAVRAADGVQVTVEDSGPGFNPDDLPRLFEQFYRGEQARSRATGGAGLGLAIAKGIIEAHNGRIWAENRPGGGACVGFLLPNRPQSGV